MQRIHSVDDPRVAPYRNMKQRTACGEGLFVTEGLMLTHRLLTSRFTVESVFMSQSSIEQVTPLIGPEVPVYVASREVLQQVVGFPFHRGVLGAGRRGRPLSVDDLLPCVEPRSRANLIVCPHVNQPENLGLIFRTAAAFGIEGVLLGSQTSDPLSRRCLRLSMGGALRVPFAVVADLPAELRRLKACWGFELVATALDDTAEPLHGAHWHPRTALLFGNEFEGLPTRYLEICDRRLTIAMQPGTDSLNVGVAAGIFVYELTRRGTSQRQ